MDQNEASLRRELVVKHPATGEVIRYQGATVYSVTPLGIVIATRDSRIFYPWSKVEYFTYHNADTTARKVIQGW